jgi:hypothetical protein
MRSVRSVTSSPRIVLAHGDVIESGGRDILRDAYTWLKS